MDAPLTCACCCAGAELPLAAAGTSSSDGKCIQCTLCCKQIRARQPDRPYGAGRAHQSCIKAQNRHAVATHTPVQRSKRPYDTLQPTQQYKRRKQLHSAITDASQQIGCPVETLHMQQRTTPEELIHLPTSVREQIRSVPSLHIPCEQTIIACKKLLATTHATETGTFAGGAYITDPVRYVSVLCAQSSLLVVGGDTGDGLTKLGVTYMEEETQKFAALLVYRGKDDYDDLGTLTQPSLTPFTGDSAASPHIFSVLQHFVEGKKVSGGGQWRAQPEASS